MATKNSLSEDCPTISAIIITKNEEALIHKCLESVKFCSEIVLVDNGSEDRTLEIAEEFKCKIFRTASWPGFGLQKQLALSKATGEWVFSIDADERVSSALANEIHKTLNHNSIVNGFYVSRKNFFLGRELRHGGWSPDWTLRLARRKEAAFTDAVVHEKLVVRGPLSRLNGPLLHYSYTSLEQLLKKQEKYITLSASVKRDKGLQGGLIIAFGAALFTFIKLYLFRLGVLDGRYGLIAALAKSQESFWKYTAIKY